MRVEILVRLSCVLALASGCSTSVDVRVSEAEALSRSWTWDWRFDAPSGIDAPGLDAATLDAELRRGIERALRESGFERARDHVDFFVRYRLVERIRTEEVVQPLATYVLSSLHSSPSFVVERSVTVTRQVRRTALVVEATAPEGRLLWRGQVAQSEAPAESTASDLVALLFERFPHRISVEPISLAGDPVVPASVGSHP